MLELPKDKSSVKFGFFVEMKIDLPLSHLFSKGGISLGGDKSCLR
jgi:hypothetical protein